MFSNFLSPRKFYSLWENVENYCTAKQATDKNMAHGHSLLDK
jgi:hypothetical protein